MQEETYATWLYGETQTQARMWGTDGTYPAFPANEAPADMRRARTEKIDSKLELFLFQFLESLRKETALRFLPHQGERLLIRSTGLRNPP